MTESTNQRYWIGPYLCNNKTVGDPARQTLSLVRSVWLHNFFPVFVAAAAATSTTTTTTTTTSTTPGQINPEQKQIIIFIAMPLSVSTTTSPRVRSRARSHSPSRTYLEEDADKPLRRGRKPGSSKKRVPKPSTPDFDNSFNSSVSSLLSKSTTTSQVPEEELDFLSKSPAGHQWRNKKLWQTNAGGTQRRYEEYSGKKAPMATPQGMEREMRRQDIRKSLMASMDVMELPDL